MQPQKLQHSETVKALNSKDKQMKITGFVSAVLLVICAVTTSIQARAQEVLSGDTRLACEAMLCLASGTRPSECNNSLRRYFSISYRRFSDTIRGRVNFLKLCPASNQTPQMQSLANAIANGAGRCDAGSLNTELVYWTGGGGGDSGDGGVMLVSNQLPDYCSAYITNPYTSLGDITPRYVGIPERGGYWVPANEYDAALVAYNARIAAEDAANNGGGYSGGNGG